MPRFACTRPRTRRPLGAKRGTRIRVPGRALPHRVRPTRSAPRLSAGWPPAAAAASIAPPSPAASTQRRRGRWQRPCAQPMPPSKPEPAPALFSAAQWRRGHASGATARGPPSTGQARGTQRLPPPSPWSPPAAARTMPALNVAWPMLASSAGSWRTAPCDLTFPRQAAPTTGAARVGGLLRHGRNAGHWRSYPQS